MEGAGEHAHPVEHEPTGRYQGPGSSSSGCGKRKRAPPEEALIHAHAALRTSANFLFAPGPAANSQWAPLHTDESLQSLFDALHEQVALLDGRGRVIAFNAAWRRACPEGATAGGGIGMPYLELCRAVSGDLGQAAFRQGVQAVIAGRAAAFTFAYATGGETIRRRQARISTLGPHGGALLVAIHEDVDPGDAAGPDVLTVQAEERKRFAMELHDATSQHLVALGFTMARLRRVAGEGVEDLLEEMAQSVAEVVKEVRILSFLTRPPGLERGLEASARAFVRGFGRRASVETTFAARGPLDQATTEVQHAAFRILQEGLSNAFRHAEASHVAVRLELAKGVLTVSVADDGKGVKGLRGDDLTGVSLGVGIVGMRSRAAQFGGRLAISSEGGGTRLVALLPALAEADAAVERGRILTAEKRAISRD